MKIINVLDLPNVFQIGHLSIYVYNIEAKDKYRGMFEIGKSGDKSSSGEIGKTVNQEGMVA